MTLFKMYLFGSPRLQANGATIQLQGRKVWALLAYLAVTRQPQSRDHLATLLWPEHDQAAARSNLRRELSRLKMLLGNGQLQIEREQVTFRQEGGLWLDVAHFYACIQESRNHSHASQVVCTRCLHFLQEAVSLNTADFLAGFYLADSPAFDEWHYFQNEALRQALASALKRLVAHQRIHAQFDAAIDYARRWLMLDPLHEPAHRCLMELYASAGQPSAALRQYAECQRILGEELGIAPEAESQALYDAIRTRRFPVVAPLALPEIESDAQVRPATTLPQIAPHFLRNEGIEASSPQVFVGRGRELAELEAALRTASQGHGQLLFVMGDAGCGKTALMQEFVRRAQETDLELLVVTGNCNAHTGIGDPYLPFREAMTLLTGEVEAKWAGGLITSPHARRLWQAMALTIDALVEQAPELVGAFVPAKALYARATTFASPDSPWFRWLTTHVESERGPSLEEKQLFRQYTAALKAIAAHRPLLLILEDLQWVDTPSSSLFFHISRELSGSRILLVGTYRPNELALGQSIGNAWGRHPLTNLVGELKRQHGDIWLDLGDMTPVEERHFVNAYLDTQPNHLGEAFRIGLFRQTGGHALFTIELLRDMQERGDLRQDENGNWVEGEAIKWQSLPAKVEGVLENHIGRLESTAQALLRVASVEGEIFTAEVVARIQQMDERALVQRLSHELDRDHRLVTAHSLELFGRQRLSRYRFRHYLFQHYLYHSLDEVERAYLHEAVGATLETLYQGQIDQIAVQLARHFELAGLVEKAVGALIAAAKRAQMLAAHQEAIYHVHKALALLETLPDNPVRNPLELELQIMLGNSLIVTQGYAAPAVENAFLRARALYHQPDDASKLWAILCGLWASFFFQEKLALCYEQAHELLVSSQGQTEAEPRLIAHVILGRTLHLT